MKWTMVSAAYTQSDIDCYTDPARVDAQFCLPTPFPERVFSSALDNCSRAARLAKGKNERMNNLANLLAVRWIKQNDPEAWIWDERYHFWDLPAGSKMLREQEKFVEVLGSDRLREFQYAAAKIRLQAHSKGRPDLATYSPQSQQWRFIEAKRTTADKLNPDQILWLENLADFFGPGSAIHLQFYLTV